MDGGAWWTAVHGVAQSQTQLKRLSMHACIGEGKGSPLQHSCLENPRDGGAWWAAIYGVAQSRTRLKWLSSRAETFLFSFVFFHCPLSLLQECAPSMYSLTGFLIDFSIGGKSLYHIVMVFVLQQHDYTYIASLHSPHPTPLDHQSAWLGSLCYIATSQACYTEWSKSEREKQICMLTHQLLMNVVGLGLH